MTPKDDMYSLEQWLMMKILYTEKNIVECEIEGYREGITKYTAVCDAYKQVLSKIQSGRFNQWEHKKRLDHLD